MTHRTMSNQADQVFHVSNAQANQTLAAALRHWLPGKTWNQARELVARRRVLIDGNLCVDPARRLKEKEVVKLLGQAAAELPREEQVNIRYLDAHVVVVEKPAGMTTMRHPEEHDWPARRKQLQPTLDELLPRLIAKQSFAKGVPKQSLGTRKKRGKGPPPRVRPVHRLDRETSGLMIFARTVDAERRLGLQFRKHSVHRRYLAIVHGDVEAQTVDSHLVRDRGDGRRGSTKLPKTGKRAVTHIRPIEKLSGYTLVECHLETGRTHQIRIHLAELGHPVCGEKVYNQPLFEPPREDKSGAPRVALHAAELGFTHPITDELMLFKMQLPADLATLLVKLRQRAHKPA
jgi:23S rRNA pseudouridine1911/1915/1917 synthase